MSARDEGLRDKITDHMVLYLVAPLSRAVVPRVSGPA
jgi:hypothetical protein